MEFEENPPSGNRPAAIDEALRSRVDRAVEGLKRSLDAATARPTPHNLQQLREATDQVMRASARVLIELGRREDIS